MSEELDQEPPENGDVGQIQGQIQIGLTNDLIEGSGLQIEDILRALQEPNCIETVSTLAADKSSGNNFQVDQNRIGDPEIKTHIQDDGIVITVLFTADYDPSKGKEEEETDVSFPGEEGYEDGAETQRGGY